MIKPYATPADALLAQHIAVTDMIERLELIRDQIKAPDDTETWGDVAQFAHVVDALKRLEI